MDLGVTKDIAGLVLYLAPGFFAAWIFYGLTAHLKASAFERIVQALIFTLIVHVFTSGTRGALLAFGRNIFAVGAWTDETATFWSAIYGLIMGLSCAVVANKNWLHERLRTLGWTKRSSYPSEWYSAFNDPCWIVLHLKDHRRLQGWPREWPDHPDRGHFVLEGPIWLLETGEKVHLETIKLMLVAAANVEMVEFIHYEDEWNASSTSAVAGDEREQVRTNQVNSGDDHDSQVPSTPAENPSGKRRKRQRAVAQ